MTRLVNRESDRGIIYLAALEPSVPPTRLASRTDGSTSRWKKELLRVGSWASGGP